MTKKLEELGQQLEQKKREKMVPFLSLAARQEFIKNGSTPKWMKECVEYLQSFLSHEEMQTEAATFLARNLWETMYMAKDAYAVRYGSTQDEQHSVTKGKGVSRVTATTIKRKARSSTEL